MDDPASRTLKKALAVCGSKEALAIALRVAPEALDAFLLGTQAIPNAIFLAALDVVAGLPPRAKDV